MARLQALVRDGQGNVAPLPTPIVADDAQTYDQVVGTLKARGLDVVTLRRMRDEPAAPSAAPTPVAPTESLGARALRAAPAFAGMARGAAMGGEMGGIPGAIVGAGLGSGLGEGALALGQRLLGVQTPGTVGERMKGAAETGALIETGIRGAGLLARGVGAGARALGGALGFGEKAAAEPTMAGLREAGMVASVGREVEKGGGSIDAMSFARKVRPALRGMLRDVERGLKDAPPAQKQALESSANSLRQLVTRTASLAPVAHAVAKDPVLLADLLRQGGPQLMPELQSAWLTAAVAKATGRTGISRGLLDGDALVGLFDELGNDGQRALFGTRAPVLRKLFDTIRATAPAVEGSAAKGHPLLLTAQTLLAGAGGAEILGGHMMRGIGLAGAPLILGKLLLKNGGAEWLTEVATRMAQGARPFAEAAPQLARFGAQLLREEAPAAPQLGFSPMASR